MKTKKSSKKLTLDKRTIVNLDFNGMRQIKGMGTDYCTATCQSVCPNKCPITDPTVGTWLQCL